jgi:hypothetical protein
MKGASPFLVLAALVGLSADVGAESWTERTRTDHKVPKEEWLNGFEIMMCSGGTKATIDGKYHCKHSWVTHIYDPRDMYNKSIMSITNSGYVVIEELRERYGPESVYADEPHVDYQFLRRWGLTDPDEGCSRYRWEMSKVRVTVLRCASKTITTLTDKTYENLRRTVAAASRPQPVAAPAKPKSKSKTKSKPNQQGVPRRD